MRHDVELHEAVQKGDVGAVRALLAGGRKMRRSAGARDVWLRIRAIHIAVWRVTSR